MDINLTSTKEDRILIYIELLNPILRLKRREKELIVAMLKIYEKNIKFGEDYVFKKLNSTESKKKLREDTKFSEPSFNNHLKQLRDKKIIINGKIIPLITNNISGNINKFSINYNVSINIDG